MQVPGAFQNVVTFEATHQ